MILFLLRIATFVAWASKAVYLILLAKAWRS